MHKCEFFVLVFHKTIDCLACMVWALFSVLCRKGWAQIVRLIVSDVTPHKKMLFT